MSKKSKNPDQVENQDSLQPTTIKVVEKKKKGGCGTFFMGFLFCFVFLFVSIGGVALYAYYNVTLTQIENVLGLKLPIEGEIRDKSLKDIVALGLEYKSDITETTIETLNTTWGVDLPQSIPGTDINISAVYDAEITFLGSTKSVKSFRIQDIVNNLNDFVEQILPVLYDNVTVGQILSTLDVDLLNDLNYPALTDEFYNVSTTQTPDLKTLSELTINQALDKIPAYFGNDNLTVQTLIDAFGLAILPYPEEGQTDIYANLRNLKITSITANDLTSKVTGKILNDLFDLTSYKFTQTDGFNNSTLDDIIDTYIKTIPLGDFISVPDKENLNTAGDHILYALRNATYNDITNSDLINTLVAIIDRDYADFTLNKIINFNDLENIDFLGEVKFSNLLSDATTTLTDALENVYIGDFITVDAVTKNIANFFDKPEFKNIPQDTKLSNLKTVIQNLTISQIFNSTDLQNFTSEQQTHTLKQLLYTLTGSLQDNFTSIDFSNYSGFVTLLADVSYDDFDLQIQNASIKDLLSNDITALANIYDIKILDIAESDDAVSILLENFGTLGEFFGGSKTGIFKVLQDITIQDLINDATTAISNALKGETAQNTTLKELLSIDSVDNKIINTIMNVSVADIFGSNAENAILNALAGTTSSPNTLQTLLDINDTTGIMSFIKNVKFGDLLGLNGADPSTAILNAIKGEDNSNTLGQFLNIQDNTGIFKYLQNVTMYDLLSDKAGTAIMYAIIGDGNSNHPYTTLGEFLTINGNTSTPSGLLEMIQDVTLNDLFGPNPSNAITNAIGNSNKTLGDLITMDTTQSGIVKKFANLKLSQLFGEKADASAITKLVNGITLADVFGTETPSNKFLQELYNLSPYSNGTMPVNEIFNNINSITISKIITTKPALFNLISNYETLTIGQLCNGELTLKENLTIQDLIDANIIENKDYSNLSGLTIQQIIDTANEALK